MDYNWITDRDNVFKALREVSEQLNSKYDFELSFNEDKNDTQSIVLRKNSLTIRMTVTRSVPYEIWFYSKGSEIDGKSIGHFLTHFFKNDEEKLAEFASKYYDKNKSDFLDEKKYYKYSINKDLNFIEINFPKVLKDGNLGVFLED